MDQQRKIWNTCHALIQGVHPWDWMTHTPAYTFKYPSAIVEKIETDEKIKNRINKG